MRCRLPVALVVLVATAAGCGGGDDPPERAPFPDGAAARIADPRTDPPLGTALPWSIAGKDAELREAVDRGFDSVTPENEMKFEALHPERDEYTFEVADELVTWATDHRKRIRGHTLIWHQQVPKWLGDRRWEPAELERVLVDHVTTVVGRYRGRIDTWDVVNEPFTDAGQARSDDGSPWLDTLGPRYVEIALRAARAADPDARLFVNEIGAELGGPKLGALVRMVRDLKARNVPIDGIGLESHLNARTPPSRARLRRTIERLAALDVDVEITELDVVQPDGPLERQAEVYADVAAACASVPRCVRLTVWGVSDRDSWLGPDQRPLPFDSRLAPKPAWPALTGALKRVSG